MSIPERNACHQAKVSASIQCAHFSETNARQIAGDFRSEFRKACFNDPLLIGQRVLGNVLMNLQVGNSLSALVASISAQSLPCLSSSMVHA